MRLSRAIRTTSNPWSSPSATGTPSSPSPTRPWWRVLGYPLIVSTIGTVPPRYNTESLFHASGQRLPENCVETLAVTVSALLCMRSDAVWVLLTARCGRNGRGGILAQLPISAKADRRAGVVDT